MHLCWVGVFTTAPSPQAHTPISQKQDMDALYALHAMHALHALDLPKHQILTLNFHIYIRLISRIMWMHNSVANCRLLGLKHYLHYLRCLCLLLKRASSCRSSWVTLLKAPPTVSAASRDVTLHCRIRTPPAGAAMMVGFSLQFL